MSEIEVDTLALRGLTEELSALVEYCAALRSGASGFAYMLPNDWQGPAMGSFLAAFEQWVIAAHSMTETATALRDHAALVLAAYEAAVTSADEVWTSVSSQLDSVGA
jgi:uncharacterized protein YukE